MSAPMGLEFKNVASPDALPADGAGALHEGVIEALVAVTGVKDDVGDVIVPGAFRSTLETRKPKVCLGHDWNRPIGKTLQIKELMPGDPALPKVTAEGKPWPREAGAVWAQFQTNMDIDDGKNAFHSAKFYGPESTYSIGYKATTAKHKGGTRYIHELDLFEFGPVLHPANRLATLQSIKAGEPEGIESADLTPDEEKDFDPEELTLQDYLASLIGVEEKVIRYVSDSEYWGLPKGTPIRPGMKPKGKRPASGGRATATQGTTTAKPKTAATRNPVKISGYAVTRDGYAGEVIKINGDQATIQKIGESPKVVPLSDLSAGDATPDKPTPLKLTGPQREGATYAFEDSEYSDEELGGRLKGTTLEILDLGRAIDSLDAALEIMEDNPERMKSGGRQVRSLRAKLVKLASFDDATDDEESTPDAGDDKPATAKPEAAKPATKPEAAKPAAAKTETEQDVRRVAEELDLEMRPNPAHPDYIINPPNGTVGGGRVMSFEADTGKAQANNGQVIPAGRVEEFLRTWQQEMDKSKDGYPPRADWVLDQMDKPAREAAAAAESDRKKREAVANATNEELAGQAEFEVDRLVRLDNMWAQARLEGRAVDPQGTARARARGLADLELVNAELVKRGLPAYDLPGPKLSTKPTGGRSIEEILNSIPETREGQAPRWSIENGADVLDDPAGSGVFAMGPVGDGKGRKGEWTITLGNGLSIPATAVVKSVSNESAIAVSTPKKVTAWLKAMGELRGADGNPPPYGTATGPELLAWRDADGRGLKEALIEVVAPAYLKAIGKSGERSGDGGDKTKAANWRSNPALAATKLPTVMFSQFTDLGQNGKQAYILGRTEGDDHATALQRAKDMIANARGARESAEADRDALPTGPSFAPVNRTIITDDNGAESTPEGEISTTRLLSLDRSTGPAAIAAMELPELQRHDEELTRRAAALGKPDAVSPAHQAIKDALRVKQEQQSEDDAGDPELGRFQRELAEQTDDIDEARRSGVPTRGLLALALAGRRLGMEVNPAGYPMINRDLTPEQVRTEARERASGGFGNVYGMQQVDAALSEIDTWDVDFGKDQPLMDNIRAWVEGMREGEAERNRPAQKPAVTSAAMEDGRILTPVETRTGENQALGITSGDYTLRVYEQDQPNFPGVPWGYEIVNNATGGRQRSEATYRSPGSALVRAESEFQATEQRSAPPVSAPAAPEQTATITPELLDDAAESEAASVGLSETPDGALEVDVDVAERQDRVEKLIKDADAGKLKLADQSTEDLTATRRDLVDELRLQTAIRRRAPRPARPATADTPKVRPGLAGAAEDHAEALRSGDAAAIERTQARLRSSIRRSRVDSEIARSLADSITSPDDNDADQLSDLAKRLRAESRERRNTSARKRRTAKRIERARLQSLIGDVDTELGGRGVTVEPLAPELLAPDADSTDSAPNTPSLSGDQKIENDIHQVYLELAQTEEDWIRLARIAARVDVAPEDWKRVLTAMLKTQLVHLSPDSNTKVLTKEDHAAAVRVGSEDLHLIAFDRDYVPVSSA